MHAALRKFSISTCFLPVVCVCGEESRNCLSEVFTYEQYVGEGSKAWGVVLVCLHCVH